MRNSWGGGGSPGPLPEAGAHPSLTAHLHWGSPTPRQPGGECEWHLQIPKRPLVFPELLKGTAVQIITKYLRPELKSKINLLKPMKLLLNSVLSQVYRLQYLRGGWGSQSY